MPARCEEHGADQSVCPVFLLSERQREVLTLAGRGMTWRMIAQKLNIAKATVRGHLYNIRDRLGAPNTTNAVVRAVAAGEIDLETMVQEGSGD